MSVVYKKLNRGRDVVDSQTQVVTSGLWSNNQPRLTSVFTSSLQTNTQKKYYYDVFSVSSSYAEFSITYGNRLGSGSYSEGQLNDSPTRAIYTQLQQLLLGPGDPIFTIGGTNTDHVYAISVSRNNIKEKMDAGNWQLNLAELNGGAFTNNLYTGSNVQPSSSNKIISLIDNSGLSDTAEQTPSGRVYQIVSGSLQNGAFITGSSTITYGLFYPDQGMIILDANMLNSNLSFNTVTSSFTTFNSGSVPGGDNAFKLFRSLSHSIQLNPTNNGFQARSEETIKSQIVFVRALNDEFNFTTNRTFVSGSINTLRHPTMLNNPTTYITTVGLYNNKYELIAVAKTSKPIRKTFDTEVGIRVKLDY